MEADTDDAAVRLTVSLNDEAFPHTYLTRMVSKGTQLNLIDCTTDANGTLHPRLIVLEPDFLIDISVIASCFEDFGHHPLLYTLNRMKPRPNSQATLLGNLAGQALDDIINNPAHDIRRTMIANFRDKAMEYATCPEFEATSMPPSMPSSHREDARRHCSSRRSYANASAYRGASI